MVFDTYSILENTNRLKFKVYMFMYVYACRIKIYITINNVYCIKK